MENAKAHMSVEDGALALCNVNEEQVQVSVRLGKSL
jgi:hypothetical protein